MTNQSIAQVPSDLADDVIVKRFLRTVVEEVDSIKGGAEDLPSLSVINDNINALTDTLASLGIDVKASSKVLSTTENTANNSAHATLYQELGIDFRNFNSNAWNELQGKGQIKALGSEFTNPPVVLTAGTTYTVYADSAYTLGGGVTQRVMIEDTGIDLKVFYRTGDTFAVAITNGWTQL